jgi:GNAT superfamily N-acetyltransferase
MQIKTCTQDDINDLIEVSTKSYSEHYAYLWLDDGTNYIAKNFNADQIRKEISNPNSVFFLIRDGQQSVGLIKLNIDYQSNNFLEDPALELERIYLIKGSSNKGIGKKAIEFVIDFARHKGKKIICLKAMQSSKAVEFYKKQGFTIVDETTLNYPEIKSEFGKMFIMRLNLQH